MGAKTQSELLNKGGLIELPKIIDIWAIENWRLITLLYTKYKLLTKTLSMRVQKVLDQVIDPEKWLYKKRNIANTEYGRGN